MLVVQLAALQAANVPTPVKVKALQAKWGAWNAGNVKPLWGAGSGDSDGDEPGAALRRKNGKQKN